MAEQRTAKDRQQHLYLVFDDWHSGYSIRKVSLSRRSGKRAAQRSSSDSGEDSEQPLSSSGSGKGAKPLPVFMRFSALRGFPDIFTSAFGTKIIMTHPGIPHDEWRFKSAPTIDVKDHAYVSGPEPNCPVCPIYFPVGDDRLFALDAGTFEILREPEQSGPWQWKHLSYPPFFKWDVSSYGVLPDGCILVSTVHGATFIFDTNEYVWKPYGDWAFPFTGRGHYDPSLGGFVGLSKCRRPFGYLYCCTMANTGTGDTGKRLHPSPHFKRSKEKVFSKNPAEWHVSATLVHMRQGKFCLVECVSTDKDWTELDLMGDMLPDDYLRYNVGGGPQCGRFLYRLKTFSLIYGTKGDPKLKHCKNRCYSLPYEARIGSVSQDPAAFWL